MSYLGGGGRLRGTLAAKGTLPRDVHICGEDVMNNVIYIVGLVVVVIAVLSFFGLR
jgi:hypothetical protein